MLMHVILLFTFGYSLKFMGGSGALDRELKFYNEVLKDKNIRYTFVTYGDEQEELYLDNISVLPIYKFIKKEKLNFLNICNLFIIHS